MVTSIDRERLILTKEIVAEWHGLTQEELHKGGRRRRFCWPRQMAISIIRDVTDMSLPEIGRSFGFDHTTVLFSIRAVAQRREADPVTARDYSAIKESVLAKTTTMFIRSGTRPTFTTCRKAAQ